MTLSRGERLELTADARLIEIRAEMFTWARLDGWSEEQLMFVAACLRAAWGKGYWDALLEAADDRPGELARDLGYRVPDPAPAAGRRQTRGGER